MVGDWPFQNLVDLIGNLAGLGMAGDLPHLAACPHGSVCLASSLPVVGVVEAIGRT